MARPSPSPLALCGGAPRIPPGTFAPWPPIDDTDRGMVLASLEGANHAFGPNCEALEKEFAAWNGNRYALTTNSGTAALHMCVAACGCGSGDEVLVPAYSWSSSATCVLQHNAIPVFVDIDWDTMNLDTRQLESAITPRTRAIIVVHLHGLAVEMEPVLALAKRRGLRVIEDACQAHGATWRGRKAGTMGDCAAFSFNQNKNLCSGEGGMFVTDDPEILERAKMLWSFGETSRPDESRDYHVYAMGWMYRNNDLTAAFGRAQLRRLDGNLARQAANAELLLEELAGAPGVLLPTVPADCRHSWYNLVLRFDLAALGSPLPPSAARDALVQAMVAEGAPLMVWQHFILPAMTVFQARNGYGKGCPWSCSHAGPVSYDVSRFPVAQRHCDTHACLVQALRAPNGARETKLLASGIRKVLESAPEVWKWQESRKDSR